MLKRLELIGFKSFADKTRFEFPAGISAIVGPNGSGKSNVVDAVRWILGEQSAKSLRGGEMTDVIFNGSTSRKSLGLAEVTMTFDNGRRSLNYDGDEVQITRRVYRDGQGEYLINNQLSRLRDIKDLFLGSGAGGGAYCIIEQGRVDAFLQNSTRDRREIFEEAAGISRFKSKKTETLRKLDQVELNLQRLRDILAEVEKQLRRVRLDASKAQKYQEFTERLQELRVAIGLDEYGRFTTRLQAEQAVLDEARSGLTEMLQQSETWQQRAGELEQSLSQLDEQVTLHESASGQARQTISAQQAVQNAERNRATDLERDAIEVGRRQLEVRQQIGQLTASLAEAQAMVDQVTGEVSGFQEAAQTLVEVLNETRRQLDELRRNAESDRRQHMDAVRQESQARNDVFNLQRRLEEARQKGERVRRRIEGFRSELGSLETVLTDLAETDANLQDQLRGSRERLQEHSERRVELRQQADALQAFLTNLHIEQSSLQSRIRILEELESSQEGLGTGVRAVMAELATQPDLGDAIVGLIVDCLTVPADIAPLIELALGEQMTQCFVVRDESLFEAWLTQRNEVYPGRVSFMPLRETLPRTSLPIPTADQRVSVSDPSLADLPRQLLGTTIIVRSLVEARLLRADHPGMQFVTRSGELLRADGTLTIGEHHAEMGLLSRRSELRELRQQIIELDGRIARQETELNRLRGDVEALETPIHTLEQNIHSLTSQAGDLSTKIALRRKRLEDLEVEIEQGESEQESLMGEIEQSVEQLRVAQEHSQEIEQAARVLQVRIEQTERAIRKWEQERAARDQEHTRAQVQLAEVRQRLTAAQHRVRQVENEQSQRRNDDVQLRQRDAEQRRRRVESDLLSLRASAIIAEKTTEKERHEQELKAVIQARDTQREQRRQLTEQLQQVRQFHQERIERAHRHEMAVLDLTKNREALAARLREDYQLELGTLFEAGTTSEIDVSAPQVVQEEIADLRKKLTRLGSVNMDALRELEEVEGRAEQMQAQHDDLTKSQRALQEIIDKINTDSRKLFAETFATIREHFQELFRKLFMGGMADIVLENPDDVLESGIEVIARPPGKDLRSISLMSGGEKTMTAIALLLAIFRSKPSPFCLLDEVDAALDEANTARLASVVREFIDHSQFIIITHKKRTMAAADVLYGITMQESGISKQVGIRFEDWPEDGTE